MILRERKALPPGEAAKLLGKSAETVRRNFRQHRCKGERDLGGRLLVLLERSDLGGWRLVRLRARR